MTLPGYGEVYKRACEVFGIKRSAELAILVIELPLYLPLVKLKGLLGLPNKNEGRYNHGLRGHVSAFATSLYLCVKRGASVSNEVIEAVGHLPKRLAISKLELIILKTLRMTYLTIMKTLADG